MGAQLKNHLLNCHCHPQQCHDNDDGQVTDCVPDSSNAVEPEEEVDDEQHSSGSVDEVTDDDNYDTQDDYDADDDYDDEDYKEEANEEQHSFIHCKHDQ